MQNLPDYVYEDLLKSGLMPDDVRAKPLEQTERHTTGSPMSVDGYVLPYFDLRGKPVKFYRVRLFNWTPKYRAVSNEPNHIYFPPGLPRVLEKAKCFILTEGEKKAAALVKAGYAAAAVSGVDSWRNRILSMPKDIQLGQDKKGRVTAKMPAGQELTEKTSTLAEGMEDLIAYLLQREIPLVITFDVDTVHGQSKEVASASARLGFELRYRGLLMEHIRSLILRPNKGYAADKLGIDDFLESKLDGMGHKGFAEQLQACLDAPSAFPQHPNLREYLNKKLQSGKLDRKNMQSLSIAMICDLDSHGQRLICPENDSLYYFDKTNRKLMMVDFRMDANFARSPFGMLLYKKYNISLADNRVIAWINSQFAGEAPVSEVRPRRVMALKKDTFYYQVNDGTIAKVTAKGIQLMDNGCDDVLFEAGAVEPLDAARLREEISRASAEPVGGLMNTWYEVIKKARVRESTEDRNRKLLSLLYSISPWFYRWKGTQLPAEMTIGEAGSGKSSLYIMRQMVITGLPKLRNAPKNLGDWGASVASAGGLHVTDNVHMVNQQLRQELSDELCRVITEPNPTLEKRKLYTDNTLVEVPVNCVFAFTAIQQPFNNGDIIARSVITELDKGTDEIEYDTDWPQHQLDRFGGRENWVARQLVFQQRLFELIDQKWKSNHRAKFRLQNVEQLLMLAAEIYGWDGSWIPGHLEATRSEKMTEGDWTLDGLKTFAEEWSAGKGDRIFFAKEISEWAEGNEDFERCNTLTNSRSLGNYLKKNSNKVATITGIKNAGTKANALTYRVEK